MYRSINYLLFFILFIDTIIFIFYLRSLRNAYEMGVLNEVDRRRKVIRNSIELSSWILLVFFSVYLLNKF